MPKKLFIIDAMAMAFRNFHAFGQRPLQTKAGLPTSAVYGSAQFMLKLLEDEKPDYVVVATDSKEKTFRHVMYEAYKANRKEMPEDLAAQLGHFFELFSAMKIPVLKQPGMEADDIIGSLVKKFASPDVHCFIVSGDKDFMQLISPNIFMYSPKKNEPAQIVSCESVLEKFSCKPEQVIDMLAIIGDSSDNVPGVHGIGDKGASKLIHDFGSLDGVYENLDKIANVRLRNALESSKDKAYLSKKLVTIKTDVPILVDLDAMKLDLKEATANQALFNVFEKLEFKTLAAKTKQKLEGFSAPNSALDLPQPPHPSLSDLISLPIKDDAPKSAFSAVKPQNDSAEKFGKTYLIANTPELLMRCIQELNAAPEFSFDTETTGLDRIVDKPIGVSVCTRSGHGWYIPVIQRHLTSWMTPEFVLESLAPIFTNQRKIKIAHNLKFDLQMFHNLGVEICGPYGDTMLASYVINPLAKEHNLDACAFEILGMHKIATSELMGKDYSRPMADVPIEQLATYACEDADAVFQLHTHYMRALSELNLMNVYRDIEVPLSPVLARMEQAGIFINTDALFEISEKLDFRIKQLEKEIYKEAGEEFNINSPKQLQVILFEKLKIHEKLGVTRIKKTKTGFSTDVTVLEALADHPLPKAMLEFRLIAKLKSTYVDTLPQLVHPKTNRIHTSFHQTGTTTGRLSSSDPNLQNIPIRTAEGREIRKAFCASSPDRVIISADYSQIELRLLAHIADDSGLKEAFMSEKDVHTATAMKVFGISADEVTPDLRSNAKAINFGIIYGMGPQRLARETNTTMVQAKDFIEKYFAGFPQIRAYIDQAKRSARDLGYSRTITGRRRPIPEIQSRDRGVAVNGENMAVNSPIQGSAADLVKLAMATIQNQLEKSTLDAKLLLQVHDELVFECLETDAEKVIILVKTAMEGAMDLCVPLKVEVGKGRNWLEAH